LPFAALFQPNRKMPKAFSPSRALETEGSEPF
jgi:hypothetical protein